MDRWLATDSEARRSSGWAISGSSARSAEAEWGRYEAEQESLSRRVALKVLGSPSLLDPKRLARFQRGESGRAAASCQYRPGVWCRRGRRRLLLRHAVHPRCGARRGSRRRATAPSCEVEPAGAGAEVRLPGAHEAGGGLSESVARVLLTARRVRTRNPNRSSAGCDRRMAWNPATSTPRRGPRRSRSRVRTGQAMPGPSLAGSG